MKYQFYGPIPIKYLKTMLELGPDWTNDSYTP